MESSSTKDASPHSINSIDIQMADMEVSKTEAGSSSNGTAINPDNGESEERKTAVRLFKTGEVT